MKEKNELQWMLVFTLGYLVVFTVLAIVKGNYEFLYYTFVMSALILLVILYHKKLHLPKTILLGLTLLGALHIFGGNLSFLGTRLYDIWLVSDYIKYDNLVHSFGIFIATFVAYNILHPHLDKKINHNAYKLSLVLVAIAMGIGAFNEVIELGAVAFLNAAEQVGDYMNNALDLVFNLLGSAIACIFITKYHNRTFTKKNNIIRKKVL